MKGQLLNQISLLTNLEVFLISIFLIIGSYTDIKYRKVYTKFNFLILLLRILLISLIGISMKNIYGLLIGFLIMFIPGMLVGKAVGGDIKTVTVLGFLLGPGVLLLTIGIAIISGLLTSIYLLKRKIEKGIPFVFNLGTAFLLIVFVKYLYL